MPISSSRLNISPISDNENDKPICFHYCDNGPGKFGEKSVNFPARFCETP